MSRFALVTLLPLWAVTLAVGFTAARLSRQSGRGLQLLCILQGGWVTGLILLESGQAAWAERLLPSGMLMAGAFVQAHLEMSGQRRPRVLLASWLGAGAVALLGLLAPRLLYGPGAHGPGPLFWPLALVSTLATALVHGVQLRLAWRAAQPQARRRRLALFVANVFGALGGGFAIALHILNLASVGIAAPFLLASILTAAYAVWSAERERGKDLLLQGLVLTGVTSVLTTLVVVGMFALGRRLLPGDGASAGAVAVVFLVLFPLEPLRALIADRVLGALFPKPMGVLELSSQVEQQEQRAEHSERLAEVGRVASAVAHEVRNPLGVILAEVALLQRSGADAASLEEVKRQVARANRFVEELLHYARPRPLHPEETDASGCVQGAIRLVTRAMEGSGSRLRFAPVSGIFLEADPGALQDVLRNLVGNALMATHGRDGAWVDVQVREEPEAVRFTVEDNGPGVPAEIAAHLFEPFVTGRGREDAFPGTGLGLAICKRLSLRHGARLWHERPDAGGARFVLLWPKRFGV